MGSFRRNPDNDNKYAAGTYAVWEIRGADPNCDWGGSHGSPRLGIVEGRYDECLAYARTLGGWSQWGDEGYLDRLNVKKIDSPEFKEKVALEKKMRELEVEKKRIEERLAEMDVI